MPAFFSLRLVDKNPETRPYTGKKLLNTEKIMFRTKENALPTIFVNTDDSITECYLIVSAERESISFDKNLEQSPIIYNIGN